jgi:predicted extracellular nuclease
MKILNPAILLLLLSLVLTVPLRSQSLMFYNCENLFDTIDDPNTDDAEFLPQSKNQWNTGKYQKKLQNLARVIQSASPSGPPAVIGLCEIENAAVLEDLVAQPEIAAAAYKVVHFECSDPRGIDVALLYRPSLMAFAGARQIPVIYPGETRKTREILHVTLVAGRADTLHFFINHWKSRIGGTEKTAFKRNHYARVLRQQADSLFAKNTHASVIIMGDFNDTPADSSMRYFLNAEKFHKRAAPSSLYNLSIPLMEKKLGTHYYKGWEVFDQIIVSSGTIKKKRGMRIQPASFRTFSDDKMLYKNNAGDKVPSRTYSSGKYYGGYSDHLPVLVDYSIK